VTGGTTRRGLIRVTAGVVISVAFIAATIRGVNLAEVGAALGRVDASGVALAIGFVGVEVTLRAIRWQALLRPVARIPLRRCLAYLSIGYFANSMLPARLGDLARAYLAGKAFGIGRLAVLGTIVVERLADGLFILAVVALLGISLAGGASLASTAVWLAVLGAIGAAGLVVALVWIRSSGGGAYRARLRSLVERVLKGADALRSPSGLATTVALTVAAFGSAVVMFALIARASGVELSVAQCALVMGGVALSTSIPAAPGSIGTYEFVGLTILVAIGVTPELALAIVVLVHVVTTLPVAILGLLVAWRLHFRISDIAADAEPALVGSDG
jgi:uncharacterized protein (TIRG00374 family)